MPFLRQKNKKEWVKNTQASIFTGYKSYPGFFFTGKNPVLVGTTVALGKGVIEIKSQDKRNVGDPNEKLFHRK